ncbi:hypothetical protein MHLP_03710 [Candidatus Mycoplasma haematolamae str. Purdue]|uniref:Uncharacterized protein n=1 Tax=Mycoplasma haematolamae (strain Purdue) TaxID=1212765 RepID=I7C6Z1_MYCHA|nr:hypothetical protein [Candidatus Mycoplasma haematolamae]AFO52322.1 hypothetical protein MHLP_03710 [Candidatus Mycoplasma haematolamae str. Purdue]
MPPSLTSLWLKGLSSQGKIYLATSSLALGAGVTGSLAVDDTRESIWSGVSYVGSSVSGFLGKAFEASGAPPAQVSGSDDTVNEIFKEAWDGLKLVVTKGANWSWNSTIFLGDKVTKAKSTYETTKGYTETSWTFLKTNWRTLWEFLRHCFTSLDVEKIYKLLRENQSTVKQLQEKGHWNKIVKSMESLRTKSYSIGFDVGKPYRKMLNTFMNKPSDMVTIVSRLDILEGFLNQHGTSDTQRAKKLVEFFSSDEQTITQLKYT